MTNGKDNVLLQEITADLAGAVEWGSNDEMPVTANALWTPTPRFTTEVVDYNRFDVIDSNGREYVVMVSLKEER